jgi:hypothetical protein
MCVCVTEGERERLVRSLHGPSTWSEGFGNCQGLARKTHCAGEDQLQVSSQSDPDSHDFETSGAVSSPET